ncbi:Lecithin:cholesterol acyltransferase-domain-containing protein [Powellomyces hirtus]|nr:Lecithin:cholesterol acyltransferase-domain-containing protein [Powellomyces hirtus]
MPAKGRAKTNKPRSSSVDPQLDRVSPSGPPVAKVKVTRVEFRKALLQFRRLFFALGVILGVLSAVVVQQHLSQDPSVLPEPMQRMWMLLTETLGGADFAQLFSDGVPGLSSFDILSNLTALLPFQTGDGQGDEEYSDFLPGARLAGEGLRAKHPVVLIPGIVSTGLQVWNTAPIGNSSSTGRDGDDEISTASVETEKLAFLPTRFRRSRRDGQRHSESPFANDLDQSALAAIVAANRACGQKYFRKRMWGTLDQIKALLLNKECWMHHMMLNERTGRDPHGVKLRAAQGLDAADYLFPGYVWAKILSNLGCLGYDSNSMHLAAYDWRLSYRNLETRDLYFTKLKSTIEIAYKQAINGGATPEDARIMVISHSMGATVFLHFLNWVRSTEGEEWCAQFLGGWVNIAGTLLGVPKSLASMLSGEMRDTAQLNAAGTYMLERFFSRRQRARLFRSWGGMAGMFPYGGTTLWGDASRTAPDEDPAREIPSYGALIDVKFTAEATEDVPKESVPPEIKTEHFYLTAENVSTFIAHHRKSHDTPYWADTYLYGLAQSKRDLQAAKKDPRAWSNPLLTPLPKFHPDFKIVCLYGTGLPAERKYFYEAGEQSSSDVTEGSDDAWSSSSSWDELYIDHQYQDPDTQTVNGVQMSDGDGTVPLLSLSYMCTHGWKKKRYNPGGISVIVRETPAVRRKTGLLGGLPKVRDGPESADHVDILGNYNLTADILRIVSGNAATLTDRIYSDALAVGDRVHLPAGLD